MCLYVCGLLASARVLKQAVRTMSLNVALIQECVLVKRTSTVKTATSKCYLSALELAIRYINLRLTYFLT